MATICQSFLQLPYQTRCNIYIWIGIISTTPIVELKWWIDKKTGHRVPQWIPTRFFYSTSKEVLTDAFAVFWSENIFQLQLADFPLPLRGTFIWSFLRYLTVKLDILPVVGYARDGNSHSVFHRPEAKLKNDKRLQYWQEVCVKLGAHSPPSHLTLHLQLHLVQVGDCRDMIDWAKKVFGSMLKLPVLKKVSIEINARKRPGLYWTMNRLLRRLTCFPSTERRPRSPFRFMDLPTEIQYMILERTDLIAPGPVVSSALKGYGLDDCYYGGTCTRAGQGRCCEEGGYDSSQRVCWSLPVDLFSVNRLISAISTDIFFSRNNFVVNISRVRPPPRGLIWNGCGPSSPRILQRGIWNPETSKFLMPFPRACIPMLRSVTWRFPMSVNGVILTPKASPTSFGRFELAEADWIHAVDFIAQNVQSLSNLTITLEMCQTGRFLNTRPTLSPDEVVHPLRELHERGFRLRDIFVHLSTDRNHRGHAIVAEELRLKRLAMGEEYHPTKEELEFHRLAEDFSLLTI
ncbi:hypothetical protein V8E54_007411 [Elaphomyces granulatus]